jgi:hypothetical protein
MLSVIMIPFPTLYILYNAIRSRSFYIGPPASAIAPRAIAAWFGLIAGAILIITSAVYYGISHYVQALDCGPLPSCSEDFNVLRFCYYCCHTSVSGWFFQPLGRADQVGICAWTPRIRFMADEKYASVKEIIETSRF